MRTWKGKVEPTNAEIAWKRTLEVFDEIRALEEPMTHKQTKEFLRRLLILTADMNRGE